MIKTRCPICGHNTLDIDHSGYLVCTWLECKDPTGINRLAEVFAEDFGYQHNIPIARWEALTEIHRERAAQDRAWRTGRSNEAQYQFDAPHILVLEECVSKLRRQWYGELNDGTLRERFVKIAAVALRALEEIQPTTK